MADHNTRTTSWQRPNSERLMHFATWQNQRSHVVSQGNQRFLYQTQAAPTGGTPAAQDDDDGLGPLPDGEFLYHLLWILIEICFTSIYRFSHVEMSY